jgi:hypothetical protein
LPASISCWSALARDAGGLVHQLYRVTVHREQARLLQLSTDSLEDSMFACKYFLLERGLPAMQPTRSFSYTVSSFIAGKRAPAGVALEVFMAFKFFCQ